MLETTFSGSINWEDAADQSISSEDEKLAKAIADRTAEEQFELLVANVLEKVQITGKAYAYRKTEEEAFSDTSLSEWERDLLKKGREGNKFKPSSLFHKEALEEGKYNLQASLAQEFNDLQTEEEEGREGEKAQFLKRLQEMRENKHFRKFLIAHDERLKKGFDKIDHATLRENYFAKMLLEHLAQTNEFRIQNKDVFAAMKENKHFMKTMAEIKRQKRKVMQAIGPVKGNRIVQLSRIAEKDIGCHLKVREQQSQI